MPDFFRKAVAFLQPLLGFLRCIFQIEKSRKNAILSLTEAKALGEKITKRLLLYPAARLPLYGWVSTSGSPGL